MFDEPDDGPADETHEIEAELDDPTGLDALAYFGRGLDYLVNYPELLDQVDDDDVRSALNLTAIECCRRLSRVMRDDLGLDPDETEIGHG